MYESTERQWGTAGRGESVAGPVRDERSQIRTRDRVRDLAEVHTHEREVKSMLDLVPEMSPPQQPGLTSGSWSRLVVRAIPQWKSWVASCRGATGAAWTGGRLGPTSTRTDLDSDRPTEPSSRNPEDCDSKMDAFSRLPPELQWKRPAFLLAMGGGRRKLMDCLVSISTSFAYGSPSRRPRPAAREWLRN